MLSIGEFSKICHVTTRTLRHYDDIDLIKPKLINEENNYRFYDTSQIRQMLLISRLKSYNFSLEEIKCMMDTKDKTYIVENMVKKEKEINKAIKKYRDIEKQMKNDILSLRKGLDIMSFIESIEVKLVQTKNINILSSRQKMSTREYGKFIGKLFEFIASNKLTVLGPPMSIYYDEEFDNNNNDTEVAIPIKEKNEKTRMLKGTLCVMVEFKGPYSNLSSGYGKITEWIDENNYKIDGAPFEKYIKGPIDDGEIVTEIYFPVKKK